MTSQSSSAGPITPDLVDEIVRRILAVGTPERIVLFGSRVRGDARPSSAGVLESLDLSELTPYAVETRYDAEFWPDRATADAAVTLADSVVDLISAWLSDDDGNAAPDE